MLNPRKDMKTKLIPIIHRGSASVDPRFSAAMLTWTANEIRSLENYNPVRDFALTFLCIFVITFISDFNVFGESIPWRIQSGLRAANKSQRKAHSRNLQDSPETANEIGSGEDQAGWDIYNKLCWTLGTEQRNDHLDQESKGPSPSHSSLWVGRWHRRGEFCLLLFICKTFELKFWIRDFE